MTSGGGFIAGSIIAQLLLDKTGWNQAIAGVIGADAAKLKGTAKEVGQAYKDVGQQMTQAGIGIGLFGGAILGAVTTGVKAFATFDAAMTESLAIMGDLSDALRKDLVEAARQVAKETTFTSAEAAKALYFLASAGYSAAEAVKTLPVVAKFAQAGMFDLAQATSLLADAQSALGLRIRDDAVANMKNMVRVADVLSKANIMANASIQQFSESLTTRAGAALRLVNKDVEEGVAVLAAFADQGVKGAEAGTRLDIVLRDLQTRAIENKAVFEKYRVSVFDASGDLRNMADIIGDLEKALAGKSDEMKRSILMEMQFADRSVASILNLVGMSDAIRKYEAELRKAGGTTEEIANKQLQTLNSQLKLTQNAISGMAASFGETLAPTLTKIVENIRGTATEIAELARKYPQLASGVSLAAAGLGIFLGVVTGGLILLGTMARSIGSIIQFMPGLAAWFSRLIPLVSQFALVAASAFAGWNFGRWIGEVTGLDEVYQRLFDTVFRFLGIIKETNIELGSRHAEAYALQTEAIARATQLAGKEVKNFIEAKHVLEEAFRKAGTTGNQVLDDWLKKFPPVVKKVSELGTQVFDLAGALTEFGLKTRRELTKELQFAEHAMAELLKSTEKTPGAVQALKEKIADLKEQLTGVAAEARSLAEQLGIVSRSDLEAELGKWKQALKELGLKVTADEFERINAKIKEIEDRLKADIIGRTAVPAFRNLRDVVSQAVLVFEDVAYGAFNFEDALKDVANQAMVSEATVLQFLWNIRAEFLSTIGIIVPRWKTMAEAGEKSAADLEAAWAETTDQMAKAFGEAFSNIVKDGLNFKNLVKDIAQGLINSVATMLGKFVSDAIKDIGNIKNALSDLAASATKAFLAMGVALAAFVAVFLILPELIKTIGELFDWLGGKWDELQATMTEETWDPREEWEKAFYAIKDAIRGVQNSLQDLDDAWSTLLGHAKNLGEESSKWLIDLIRNFREAGKESKALNEYVLSWLDTIPAALLTLVRGVDILKGSLVDAAGKLKTGKDLLAALDWRKLHLEELEGRLGELGRIAITTFNSMLASGKSWIDVVDAMGPVLTALREKYKQLGIDASASLAHLFRIVGVTEKHRELFEAIDATRQILIALGNSVWLTAGAWKTLTGDIVSQFHALRHGGLSVEDSLRAMVPSLQAIVNYAAAYGFELDKQTQSLVDQAKKHGWIKEAQKTEANVLVEGFNRVCDILIRIAEVLGADVSDLMTDISTTAGKFYKTSKDTVTAWKPMDGILVPFNESLEDAIALAKKLGITVSEIGHDMTPFVTTTGGEGSGMGPHYASYASGGIAWTRQLAEVGWPEPEVITPLSKYREPGQAVNVTFNINAIDRAGVEAFLRRDAKPILQRMLDREELTTPLGSVGG